VDLTGKGDQPSGLQTQDLDANQECRLPERADLSLWLLSIDGAMEGFRQESKLGPLTRVRLAFRR
jgi:hypothetical protein